MKTTLTGIELRDHMRAVARGERAPPSSEERLLPARAIKSEQAASLLSLPPLAGLCAASLWVGGELKQNSPLIEDESKLAAAP